MKLVGIRVYPLAATFARQYGGLANVPPEVLAPASHFRRIPRTGQYATLVKVTAANGLSGWGEGFGLPYPLAAASLIENVVAPAIMGQDIEEPACMLADLATYFRALGHTRGPAIEALAAVDIALWDLIAKAAGQPLATRLGGSPGPVETYVSPVALLPTPAASAAAARDFVAQGYHAVKLKIGRGVAVDLDHIAAVREALGRHQLMLDANCAYGVEDAIALAEGLRDLDIAWLEEPIPPDDPAALAAVRRASPVPIAAGENEFTLPAFEALAKAGAVDILQPNITRAGGVSGLMAIGELCAREGLKLAPHGVGTSVGVSAALHVCRALPAAWCYEANRMPNALRDELPLVPLSLANGDLVARDAPGHGGDPDVDRLAEFLLSQADAPKVPA
ncbi:mandelate racemase/muconate lactonizing enzyme family protein [Chelatococcus asaccharovorans]|uniref:L-alanine-DL-glutamate epimerase-like enolase superfamily enzyme n=1 Tax=Chelatococcus asaccharovorans TaxID=28210 RepID=A0A2V3UHK1_9HYPH|nr:mandelate racemase/muconate lactonizing enzyme family protein [Chelatococcus asaccharovorans]MBS7701790.1 mandelate racemase/muconate lactonizing enzyme family protein [Chelatococcus asaccharovorans]PXW64503.1 L-alanine-DL-glutamate epimerase-like enolase superfamily enzyme [Chelatococcus asaccharovorans]